MLDLRRASRVLVLLAVAGWTVPARAAEGPCSTENLVAGKMPIEQRDVIGDAKLVTDGAIAADGAMWDAPAALRLETAASTLTYDLGREQSVSAFYVQADANDTYQISGSADGKAGTFTPLAQVANVVDQGHGLRGRVLRISPMTVRYLRVGEASGDGYFSLSEFAAYCEAPSPFPPAFRTVDAPMASVARPPAEKPLEPASARAPVGAFEILLALGIAALLVIGGLGARGRRPLAAGAVAAGEAGETAAVDVADQSPARLFALVLLLFVGSGCAALIYEIVWFQLLQLVLGSSAVSIGVLLGTFMGGMCLGSLGVARIMKRSHHPLRVYAVLELLVGVSGLLMLVAMPLVRSAYTAVAGHGMPELLLRGLFAAICLLPPTIMMGATLPAIARWVETSPRGVSWLGWFYGGNTLGAVIGCVLSGFYLLRVHDMPFATYVAVALNVAVAVGALALARAVPHVGPRRFTDEPISEPPAASHTGDWVVYLAIALSGMSALGAEVIWTRLYSLLLSGTTYTFSIILAVFLVGIGIGSAIGSGLSRNTSNARRAFGVTQLLLVGAIAWASLNITNALPYWPVNPRLAPSPWFQFQIDFVRCIWTILPAACLWGASFPLALASVAAPERDGAVVVGRIYAANTIGAIVGALLTSLVLIRAIGTQNGSRLLVILAGIAAVVLLVPGIADIRRRALRLSRVDAIAALVVILAASLAVRNMAPAPALLIGHGRFSAVERNQGESYLFVGEGMNSSPAVSRDQNGILSYHNAGKVQASSLPQDMRLQRMLGHLSTLIPAEPKNVLVIACGAGVTAGAASIDPRVEHLTIAEIEPLVPAVVAKYFGEQNFNVVKNPKVTVEVDDARHFLETTKQKFDAITSDPFDPWVKGAANLYTREFWQLARGHLNPGGVVTVFVQLYDSGMAAVKSEVATFFEVFPNGIIWGNTVRGEGYDVVLSGQVEPVRIDVDRVDGLLTSPVFAQVAQSLREIGFNSATTLLSTYGGRGSELGPWLADAEINRDRNLRLQFLAGFGMNVDQRAEIYRGILAERRYPDDLFTGSPEHLTELRTQMLARPR
jgi:spermidine synthase